MPPHSQSSKVSPISVAAWRSCTAYCTTTSSCSSFHRSTVPPRWRRNSASINRWLRAGPRPGTEQAQGLLQQAERNRCTSGPDGGRGGGAGRQSSAYRSSAHCLYNTRSIACTTSPAWQSGSHTTVPPTQYTTSIAVRSLTPSSSSAANSSTRSERAPPSLPFTVPTCAYDGANLDRGGVRGTDKEATTMDDATELAVRRARDQYPMGDAELAGELGAGPPDTVARIM